MKQRILTGWTFGRLLYLFMGLVVIVESVNSHQWPGLLFGAYFASMAIFNFGCAAGACYAPPHRRSKDVKEEPKFEEVKVKAE